MAGMFGSGRSAAYAATGLQKPGLGKQILNQLGMNLLGVDFEGQRLSDGLAQVQRQAEMQAAGLLSPQTIARQAQIGNADGEDITSAFAPEYDLSQRQRTPQEIAQGLARLTATVPGFNPTPYKDLANLAMPDIQYDRGYGFNKKTGDPVGPFHTELDKGMTPGADGVVRNAPGYVKSAAEAAGAVTGAQESSKAAYDLVDYDLGGGNVIKLPRAYVGAMNMKLMQGRGQPGSAGPDGASGEPPMSGMPGVARSPGQLEADKVDYQEGAKAVAGAQEASTAAATNARNASMAFDGILQLNPNQATPFIVGAKKLMATLHPDNPELQQYVGSAEGYRMLTTRMVLPKAKELGANPSNKDSEIIFKSMPGLTTPRAAGAVYFGMEAATANKEAARQAFFQNWQGDQRASAMKRAWANSPEAKKSIFQDPIFSRLTLNGHPAVVYKTSRDGRKFGVFMPYNADGSVNKSAQVFEAY